MDKRFKYMWQSDTASTVIDTKTNKIIGMFEDDYAEELTNLLNAPSPQGVDPDDLDLRVLVSNFVEGRTDATFDWIDAGELLEELKAALQEAE